MRIRVRWNPQTDISELFRAPSAKRHQYIRGKNEVTAQTVLPCESVKSAISSCAVVSMHAALRRFLPSKYSEATELLGC